MLKLAGIMIGGSLAALVLFSTFGSTGPCGPGTVPGMLCLYGGLLILVLGLGLLLVGLAAVAARKLFL